MEASVSRASSGGQVHHLRPRAAFHDGLDPVRHGPVRLIHLALADDLVVPGLQNEIGLLALARSPVETAAVAAVLLDGGDAVVGGPLRRIHFTGEDHLAIAGLQVEVKLAVLGLLKFELSGHGGVGGLG